MSSHNTRASRGHDTTVRTDCFAPTDFPPRYAHRCFSHSPSHPARLLGTLTGLTHRCSCVCYLATKRLETCVHLIPAGTVLSSVTPSPSRLRIFCAR